MLSQALLVSAVAGLAAAQMPIHPGHLAFKRELGLQARQTADPSASACVSALASLGAIYTSLPTQPPALVSWEMTAFKSVTVTDPCHFSIDIPASISADFYSYESQASSWYQAHSSEIYAALSQCPMYSSYTTAVGGVPVCTAAGGVSLPGTTAGTTPTDSNSAPGTTSTPAGSGSGSGGSGGSSSAAGGSSTSASKNAGPRETGLVVAAVAAAGFLGAAIAL